MSFSIDEISAQLGGLRAPAPGSAPPPCPPWLIESWEAPRRFFAALCEHAAARSETALKSRYGEGYDPYYDFIERCARQTPDRAALRYLDGEHGLRALSFGELHAQASALATDWIARKVGPESVVTIVMPLGPALCVALGTALRLGATACVVLPAGPAFVQNRLRGLKPTHVVTVRDCLALCAGSTPPPLVLGEPASGIEPWERSHTYAPKAPALAVVSPLRDPPRRGLPLSGEALYCHALRDGHLLLGLRPGDVLCAPGVPLQQHLPALLLAAWACGASYLHITVRDVTDSPRLLERVAPRALLVTTALRDALRSGPVLLPRTLSLWLRNPEEPFDYFAWQEFIRAQNLGAIAHGNLVVDAAAGGALMFSPRRPGAVHPEVWPAPGCDFTLLQPGTKEQRGLGAGVLFAAKPPGDKVHPGHILLNRAPGGFQYGGTLTPRRAGRAFPADEVCALLEPVPGLCASAVVPLPPPAVGETTRFALVLFTGGPVPSGLVDEVLARLRVQLGEDALPDQVLPFPLLPRWKGGAVDTAWVQDQLLRGVLVQKAREPAFQILTALRRAVRADKPPGAEKQEPGGA